MEQWLKLGTVIRRHKQYLWGFAVYRTFDKQKCKLAVKFKTFDIVTN